MDVSDLWSSTSFLKEAGVEVFLAPVCFLLDLGVLGGEVMISSVRAVLTNTYIIGKTYQNIKSQYHQVTSVSEIKNNMYTSVDKLCISFLMVIDEGSSSVCELSREFLANFPAKETSVKQP